MPAQPDPAARGVRFSTDEARSLGIVDLQPRQPLLRQMQTPTSLEGRCIRRLAILPRGEIRVTGPRAWRRRDAGDGGSDESIEVFGEQMVAILRRWIVIVTSRRWRSATR